MESNRASCISEPRRYKRICLCGSTRFKRAYAEWNARLTLQGNIVLSVGLWTHGDVVLTVEQKRLLDAIHLDKIELADEVFVLDVGGYIGGSTRGEINYAEACGKPVRYLSKECPNFDEGIYCLYVDAPSDADLSKRLLGIFGDQDYTPTTVEECERVWEALHARALDTQTRIEASYKTGFSGGYSKAMHGMNSYIMTMINRR